MPNGWRSFEFKRACIKKCDTGPDFFMIYFHGEDGAVASSQPMRYALARLWLQKCKNVINDCGYGSCLTNDTLKVDLNGKPY